MTQLEAGTAMVVDTNFVLDLWVFQDPGASGLLRDITTTRVSFSTDGFDARGDWQAHAQHLVSFGTNLWQMDASPKRLNAIPPNSTNFQRTDPFTDGRIRALEWRRSEFSTDERLKVGSIVIDKAGHEVSVRGRPVQLTAKEFALLAYLAERRGKVLSREHLLAQVWGNRYDGGPRTVDIHRSNILRKLGLGNAAAAARLAAEAGLS
mgnify:CR=1 FL=1